MAYIDLQNVTYTYPLADKPSIEDVTLSFDKGKFYAILGANGSGKTTLCNIIRGFIPQFFQGDIKGEVKLQGKNLSEFSLAELAPKMGYIFQNPFNQITGARDNVYEEIAYGLEKFGVAPDEIRKRVDRVLEMTNTAAFADKNPFELSGGQQQRVALASVIVLEPDIMVIDEPTSQLDPQETERVFDIISRMKEMGKTIILVEHKIELIAEYADEVIALENGRLLTSGPKEKVLSDITLKDHGIDMPPSVLLSEELKKRGIETEYFISRKQMMEFLKTLVRE
ncbi:energy-coupling factor ABC transporter ATP-binding protein [Clostridium transplantifaecale]|uniref:energy-coupling factor ABC transporter ATP-binding protein n=1 Tax=Clostridium transplantifaecale TaxID=2479838 RepID=UPI000F63D347|nr:ABC transporter ATP-binding protein [Clostridium transplantifaecale]